MTRTSQQNSSRKRSAQPPAGNSVNANPAADTARITARYALAGVLITAMVGTLGAALVSNWDKLFGHKSPPSVATPGQTSTGSQSPNISAAHDVTIQYGANAVQKDLLKVAGRWRSDAFKSAYGNDKSVLVFELVQQDDKVSGTLSEAEPGRSDPGERMISDGKVAGATVSFYTQGSVDGGDSDHPVAYKEFYIGTFNKSTGVLAFKRVDDLPSGGQAETFIARRVQ